jgi:hypothetical protein
MTPRVAQEHVSQLVLDELASEVAAPPGAREHVEGCAECGARLASTRRAREASVSAFGWSRTRARLIGERPARWRELMPFIVPTLAAAVFFTIASLNLGTRPGSRVKGAASVEFVRAGQKVTEAKPGDSLSVEVSTLGNTFGLLLAVDKDRRVDVLWQGELPSGAIVTLPTELEVTPGPVAVHVFLSHAAIDPKLVVPAMEASIRDYGGWPLEAPPPKAKGVITATQKLYVTP